MKGMKNHMKGRPAKKVSVRKGPNGVKVSTTGAKRTNRKKK